MIRKPMPSLRSTRIWQRGTDMLWVVLVGAAALAIAGTYMTLRPAPSCKKCGAELPKPGMPGTASHAASGRMICANCGATVDASGRVIDE